MHDDDDVDATRTNGAKENELEVLVHLRKPRLYRLSYCYE